MKLPMASLQDAHLRQDLALLMTLAGIAACAEGLLILMNRDPAMSLAFVVLTITIGAALFRRHIRQQAAALATARRHHDQVINALQEGVLLINRQGMILASNPAAARILGIENGVVAGRTTFDPQWQIIHEDGSAWPREDFPSNRVFRSGVAERNIVLGTIKPDGTLAWLSVSAVPTGDDHVAVSLTDITERRLAEQRQHELEGRFRLLVEGVQDYAVFMLDAGGRVSSWNKGAERIKGYANAEIIGQHFSVFYPEQDRLGGKPESELRIAASTGRYEEEGWRLRKDGSRFWAHVVISAIRSESGALLGYAKVSRDLTERRQAEKALAEVSQLNEAILDAAPFSIIATDTQGVIRAINPAGQRLLCYREEELVGKATPALIHDAEEVRARAVELSQAFNADVAPGFEVFVHQSRLGIVEEREWTYIRKDGSRFPVNLAVTALRNDAAEITGFLGIAYDISARKQREEYTQHIAHHDHLTGLPNRSLLADRLNLALLQSKRSGLGLAVLMLDLDHFKRVNDSLGHHIGDQLLVAVAQRIQSAVRATDTVARMGGDEFVILLPQLSETAAVERLAQNILDKVSEPITIGGCELHVTPSIGISLHPQDGDDANLLLRNADAAMYRAKSGGRRGVRLFNAEMQKATADRLLIENALHQALRAGEFHLVYQPQVCLRSGKVLGMEALLRWRDAQGKLIPPERFIPIAEESGLIQPIGDWVLRRACTECRLLQQQSGTAYRLAVNISPRQFRKPQFVAELRAILLETGLAPEHLELEITESTLMSHSEDSIARLREIRALGVGVAIDDFGVGYSSLAYITSFPISTLKIDRCFVRHVPGSQNHAAVTQAIIALAASLHIRVVAEGVETAAQLAFLQGCECSEAQGHYFSAAVPAAQFPTGDFPCGTQISFQALHAIPNPPPRRHARA